LFHSGGTVGSGDKLLSGFARLRELLSAPETIREAGTLADINGRIDEIRVAPQGGYFIRIRPLSGSIVEQHVMAGRTVKVKPGDSVKIGDELSNGSFRPQDIAEKRGMLAAQQYVVDQARKSYADAGVTVRRPVLEVLAAGLMRFTEVTNDGGEHDLTVGDVLPENVFEQRKKKNSKIEGKPTVPGLSAKPLMSHDLFERLNFQRLENALHEVPAMAGTADLTGESGSALAGIAYGIKFRQGVK
jgi:DNA-directed RNA polymerase subunit beta'